jgi:uncharacterized integral membrane protein
MHKVWWLIKWVLKAAIFFTLFAFALNNQQDTTVHFFFGNHWQAPQVLVVLTAFAVGVAVGVLGMVPWWWKQRQKKLPPPVSPLPPELVAMGTPITTPPMVGPAYADGI